MTTYIDIITNSPNQPFNCSGREKITTEDLGLEWYSHNNASWHIRNKLYPDNIKVHRIIYIQKPKYSRPK